MPESDRDRVRAEQQFIAELGRARDAAGPPAYERICALSEEFSAGGLSPGLRTIRLPSSTTHDILSGKRDGLPQWRWVASFIAVLRVIAVQDALPPECVGDIAEWRGRYESARAATSVTGQHTQAQQPQHHQEPGTAGPPQYLPASPDTDAAPSSLTPGLPGVGPGQRPDPGPRVDDLAELGPAPGDEPGDGLGPGPGPSALPTAPPTSLSTSPSLSLLQQRITAAYGRTGMRLLRRAEDGDGEAGYRLAALLACDHRSNEALYWVQRSVEAGHRGARELLDQPDARCYWSGTDAAYAIGLEYEAAGHSGPAAVFYGRAAQNGHPEAAYRAGLYYRTTGNLRKALEMFTRAARNGHPHAVPEANDLCRYDIDALAPAPPAPTGAAGTWSPFTDPDLLRPGPWDDAWNSPSP